jgi:hypothetical protein
MSYRYSDKWDKELNKLMNEHSFRDVTDRRAMLGDVEIWVENHPYPSFVKYNDFQNRRASRLTIYRAKQKLERDKINQIRINPPQFSIKPCDEINLNAGSNKPEIGDLKNGIPNNWDDEV